MAKVAKETEKTFEENLKYIGLNLDKLPAFLKKYEGLNFRPSNSYDDAVYKVYKYVNIKDIEILITPENRLTDIKQRYKLSSPICEYLDSESEENIEKFAKFIKVGNHDEHIPRIEEIAKEQEELNEKIPFEVKYPNNFIWQIYYSDYAKKYFMLVPTEEQDNNALFYLLKEQIANVRARKPRYIFTPISHMEYTGGFLSKSEIDDMENYLWYFTKDWPNIYEIFDKDNNSIHKNCRTNKYIRKNANNLFYNIVHKRRSCRAIQALKSNVYTSNWCKRRISFYN